MRPWSVFLPTSCSGCSLWWMPPIGWSARLRHTNMSLGQLHWFKAPQLMDFELAYTCIQMFIHRLAPASLADELLHLSMNSVQGRVAEVTLCYGPRDLRGPCFGAWLAKVEFHQDLWRQKTKEFLGHCAALFASSCVQPFWYNTGLWRTNGPTDKRPIMSRYSIASRGKNAETIAIKV